MTLAKRCVNLALLALALGIAPGLNAQGTPPQKPAKKAAKKAAKAAKPAAPAPAPASAPAGAPAESAAPSGDQAEPVANRRDPFLPLINVPKAGGGEHLPPGKAGLVISTVRVDGAVQSPNGMIAVVSNPEQRVYFVREGDHLYDGDVEKIGLDGVTFKENSKDAFGKPVERLVTKRIYPSAGEQQ
ncbi:MAG TPA: hypothetical protein VLY23_15115 [Candidatus Acidoferrum sp.]|nr:hypothetical protein [Candidatus Acidoferrum sp.]